MRHPYPLARLAAGAALALILSDAAQAAGTRAGESIDNTATVSFSVGGQVQNATSNTASFKVDRKVNLTVAEVGGTRTQVAVGALAQVTTFTVTNLTNDVQDFRLDPDQQSVSIPILGVDNFDVANLRAFVDVDNDGRYDPAIDTVNYIDELPADATRRVFIVGDIPTTGNPDVAIVSLRAVAAAGGTAGSLGSDLQATLTPDSPTVVDVVFADEAGPFDLPRDGSARAFDAYQVAATRIALDKSARVVSDPVNLLVAPRAIPGAVIEYCLTVRNTGATNATAITVSDRVPANTTYVDNSLRVGGLGVGECLVGGTVEDNDTTGPDETDLYGGSFDGTTVRATLPLVTPVLPLAMSFQVVVN